MTIRVDKNNSDVLVVDTLADIFELLKRNEIWVRISDNSKLREFELEEYDYD
tara:strand:+ start:436 stop:591 length:156 start_codon:yes stop_codon:yes gene_type:complete